MVMAYLALAAAGIALVCWGFPASHRLRKPFDILAALAVLAGVASFLLGTLLTVAPHFFQG
ncbi:hypothetical protein [Citrifermentans bremense]|uniref:Uncharacterized protein n=2 Tax=Citrifermentans bemidjiense TaxID=225194 RepID=B5EG52_CITBB|nr:hypothetical protein [Citrifermentans bremense]ACH40965.1 hypothetical protein Gbem_3973 [Citrifermentans bemidjiense Bem]